MNERNKGNIMAPQLASCLVNFIGILPSASALKYVISLICRSLGCVRLLNYIFLTLIALHRLKIPILLIKIKRLKKLLTSRHHYIDVATHLQSTVAMC